MSDELDPILLRHFSQAKELLPSKPFQEDLISRLHRAPGRMALLRTLHSLIHTILSGLATGLSAPFIYSRSTMSLSILATMTFVSWFALKYFS